MKKTIIIAGIIFFLLIIIGAVGIFLKTKGSAKLVQIEKAERQTITSTVIAFGHVEPKSDVNISAEVSEKIEKIFVEEGDTVAVGDKLVLLNQERFQAAVTQASAQVRQVEANIRRARENLSKMDELHKSGAVSDDALSAAKTEIEVLMAQLESANASLRQAQQNLAQTLITSPLNGIVTSISAEKGEFVIVGTMNNIGSVIMTIAQLGSMQAIVDVDEADVVDVEPGQYAKIELDAISDTFVEGTVVQVAHQAKKLSQMQSAAGGETRASFEVKIAITDASPKIRPGMSVTATITTAKLDSVLAVPLSAIVAYRDSINNKDVEGVFIVENNIVRKVRIKTGISDDKYMQVLDGIEEGDMIVTGPFKMLRSLADGDRVKAMEGKKLMDEGDASGLSGQGGAR